MKSATELCLSVFALSVAALLLLTAHAAEAGTFPTNARVGVRGLDYGLSLDPPFGFLVESAGNAGLDTGSHSATSDFGLDTVQVYGAAHAMTGASMTDLLKVHSEASGLGSGLFSPNGIGQAYASWRDIAYVSSPVPGSTLRLNFVLEGTLTSSSDDDTGFRDNMAQFSVATSTDPVNFFDPGQGGGEFTTDYKVFAGLTARFYSGNQGPSWLGDPTGDDPFFIGPYNFGPWDSTSGGGNFTGTFHIDTPYDASLGGYGWGVSLISTSHALGGSATANALSTLKLVSVTLLDDTPVAATFDSGLTQDPSPVPEPGSLVLLGLGTAGLGCVRLAKRRRNRS